LKIQLFLSEKDIKKYIEGFEKRKRERVDDLVALTSSEGTFIINYLKPYCCSVKP